MGSESNKITVKQMCEHIVKRLNPQKHSGEPYISEEIWNYLNLLKEAGKLNYEGLKELHQLGEREFAEWVAKARRRKVYDISLVEWLLNLIVRY